MPAPKYGRGLFLSQIQPPLAPIVHPKMNLPITPVFAVLRRGKSVFGFQRRRRGIFVEPKSKRNFSPVGATYSEDVALTELWIFLRCISTNMPALRA